ncbi:MAG: hypothetical protein ACP5RO_03050 [Fervidicoccaceae archaeon]
MGDEHSKNEIIEMILSGGLLEDFLNYLKERKIDVDEKKLYDLDDRVILEYAESKKLLKVGDDPFPGQTTGYEELEPNKARPRTPPRKE